MPDLNENRTPASAYTVDHRERKKTPASSYGSVIQPAGEPQQGDAKILILSRLETPAGECWVDTISGRGALGQSNGTNKSK